MNLSCKELFITGVILITMLINHHLQIEKSYVQKKQHLFETFLLILISIKKCNICLVISCIFLYSLFFLNVNFDLKE